MGVARTVGITLAAIIVVIGAGVWLLVSSFRDDSHTPNRLEGSDRLAVRSQRERILCVVEWLPGAGCWCRVA